MKSTSPSTRIETVSREVDPLQTGRKSGGLGLPPTPPASSRRAARTGSILLLVRKYPVHRYIARTSLYSSGNLPISTPEGLRPREYIKITDRSGHESYTTARGDPALSAVNDSRTRAWVDAGSGLMGIARYTTARGISKSKRGMGPRPLNAHPSESRYL
jgi:hypothetical protein